MICELCERDVNRLTVHHLIPRDEDGHHGPKANICPACHKQIHTLFDNKRLARELNSLDRLKDEPEMRKFLGWIKKQDPNKQVRVHRKK